jgi:acetyltransferase
MALTAVLTESGEPRLLGVARYYLHPETGIAKFAVVVSDPYQRQGLGRHLIQRLIDIARERGVQRLVGQVLIENTPMLYLMRSLGFSPPIPVEDQIVRVELNLAE